MCVCVCVYVCMCARARSPACKSLCVRGQEHVYPHPYFQPYRYLVLRKALRAYLTVFFTRRLELILRCSIQGASSLPYCVLYKALRVYLTVFYTRHLELTLRYCSNILRAGGVKVIIIPVLKPPQPARSTRWTGYVWQIQ